MTSKNVESIAITSEHFKLIDLPNFESWTRTIIFNPTQNCLYNHYFHLFAQKMMLILFFLIMLKPSTIILFLAISQKH